jgi:hypothetical protein
MSRPGCRFEITKIQIGTGTHPLYDFYMILKKENLAFVALTATHNSSLNDFPLYPFELKFACR